MSHDFAHGRHDGPSAATDDGARPPGKRALTDRLQRAPAAGAPALGTASVQRWSDPTVTTGLSYIDSVIAPPIQRRADGAAIDDVHALAAAGTAGTGVQLPFLDRIQLSFGDHDVRGVVAHTDEAAGQAAAGMGARAFATGNHVAFADAPDLHTAAHEAAHVVQQRSGVQLKGGIGEVGDVYERQADAVADRVVAGEGAADLLGPVPAAGRAGADVGPIQRDLALGPAGRASGPSVDPVSLSPPPKPAAGGGLGVLIDAASAAMPHVQGVMKAVTTATEIYNKLAGDPVRAEKGETRPLEPYIKNTSKEQLDRVLRYKMATMLVTDILRIGKELAGIDFTTWKGGLPPPSAAPVPATPPVYGPSPAGPGSAPGAPAPGAPAPGAPAAPAAPASANTARAELLRSQLSLLSVDDLKSRAKIWLDKLVEDNTRILGRSAGPVAMNKWYWNGENSRGFGEAPNNDKAWPYDRDHDKRTSATITWYLEVAGVPDGTMAGVPKEVAHFDPMTIESTPMRGLGWFLGGSAGLEYKKAPGDELTVDVAGGKGTPAVGSTMGGYHMRFTFRWDNSNTTMECDVTAAAGTSWPIIMNVSEEGTPET